MVTLHKENGYYSILKEGFTPAPLDLQKPRNIYDMENKVMQNVNNFQIKYARFMRCNNPNIAPSVTNPSCDLNSFDSVSNLDTSYKNVMYSIDDLNAALNTISKGPGTSATPLAHDDIKNNITGLSSNGTTNLYDQIKILRNKLDARLDSLYNEERAGPESSATRLDSTIYANTLWIILATCLIYYVIVEL